MFSKPKNGSQKIKYLFVMSNYPKISIITVCFNSAKYIGDNIASVNDQDYPNIEHIFIDGSSTDDTISIIKNMVRGNHKLVSEPDLGIYNAMNKGIGLASGKYLIFLNSDDMFSENNIITKYVEIINQKSADIVFSDILFIQRSSKNNIIRTWKAGKFNKRKLKFGWMPPHPGVIIKAEIFKKFGGFDEKFKISGDYDFLLRVFNVFEGKIIYLNSVSVIMRYGGMSNKNLKNSFRKWKEDFIAIKQNNVGSILTVLSKRLIKLHQAF
tara:strand:- start:514 stop:1317 length:804 start_codon:yes stop_codon:yes gene_type:complete